MGDAGRARELTHLSVTRELEEAELLEAAELVKRLVKIDRAAALWAYQAIRRTYIRRRKRRGHHLPLRSLERTAKALIDKRFQLG